jgi:hypothetical protein
LRYLSGADRRRRTLLPPPSLILAMGRAGGRMSGAPLRRLHHRSTFPSPRTDRLESSKRKIQKQRKRERRGSRPKQ